MMLTLAAAAAAALSAQANAAQQAAPLPSFQTADNCSACHNGLTTPSGEDVSIGSLWRGSMMANSSRDPYWQAAVRREILDHPSAQREIEDECSICHMPMATYTARAAGTHGTVFANVPGPGAPANVLAADGVSCSACHQITSEGLGTRDSFTGGYRIGTANARGVLPAFGPFSVAAGQTRIMQSATGFEQTEAAHVRDSKLCATCHTLFTRALSPESGPAAAELPEQVPYLEWAASDYANGASCQSCHMPSNAVPAPISSVLGEPREGTARHEFVGGNFFMPRLLDAHRVEQGVAALSSQLRDAADRSIASLQKDAATLTVTGTRAGRHLAATVLVENRAGHKLPTAYPSRRAWLHVTVRDASGRAIFESGRFSADGSIAGDDGDADRGGFEPHYTEITAPGEVQIYETVMVDARDRVTTGLLSGVRYIKDNRLLPAGFDKTAASADVAVRGSAADDPDFSGGSDRVRYVVDCRDRSGPFSVEAELYYQPVGYRWAKNLAGYDAPEPQRFGRFYAGEAAHSAIVIAAATTTIP